MNFCAVPGWFSAVLPAAFGKTSDCPRIIYSLFSEFLMVARTENLSSDMILLHSFQETRVGFFY